MVAALTSLVLRPYTFLLIYVTVLSLGCQAGPMSSAENGPVVQTVTVPENSPVPKFSSVYTKLDPKSCGPARKAASEQDEVPDICSGYKGYKVFVDHHGVATRITIGRGITADPNAWDPTDMPSFIANKAGDGQIIEWRLADGEPFACIVRAEYNREIVDADQKGQANELVVRNLKGFGPIEIVIDAQKESKANDIAKQKADAAYKKL